MLLRIYMSIHMVNMSQVKAPLHATWNKGHPPNEVFIPKSFIYIYMIDVSAKEVSFTSQKERKNNLHTIYQSKGISIG